GVVEPSVDVFQRKTSTASVLNDGQSRFGVSHVAYLPICTIAPTWPPLPCGRLSRPSGSRGQSPVPSPLGTGHESYPSSGSSPDESIRSRESLPTVRLSQGPFDETSPIV